MLEEIAQREKKTSAELVREIICETVSTMLQALSELTFSRIIQQARLIACGAKSTR